MEKDYFIGLDVGTNSAGWAVTDSEYNLLKAKGKTLWGVRLFDEAKTAQERRIFRSARRRLARRKQRVKLLESFFAEEISKIDMGFFQRLHDSKYHLEDKNEKQSNTLFADSNYTDKDFHKEFPTIYHLRATLSKPWEKKYDIRLVYLALHHIMKHRGHFLSADAKIEDVRSFEKCINNYYAVLLDIIDVSFDEDIDVDKIEEILKSKKTKNDKNRDLTELFSPENDQEKAVLSLLIGSKVKFSNLFNDETFDDNEGSPKDISFSDAGFDDKAQEIEIAVGSDNFEVIKAGKAVFDFILLSTMLKGETSLSVAKVKAFETHKADLKILKELVKKYIPESYDDIFVKDEEKLNNYPAYVYSHKAKSTKPKGKASYEDFKKFLKPLLEKINNSETNEILKRLDDATFLPKPISAENSVIPHQLNKMELDAILEQAGKFYDFLSFTDETKFSVAEKIEKTFMFKIPYYVGPLNTYHAEANNGKQSWAIKKSNNPVLPWTYDNVIDEEKSAIKFINRMTNKCTYLPTEDVLPKNSLLYSEYTVLNEINPLCVNGNSLSIELKKLIFEKLFKGKVKVTRKQILKFLKTEDASFADIGDDDITGIDEEIKSSMRSYHDFKDLLQENILTNEQVEKIICDITLFSDDSSMLKNRFKREYPNLSEQHLSKICSKKYSGWGRFSKKLLTGITCEIEKGTGVKLSIISAMRETNNNFMKLLSEKLDYSNIIQEERNKNNPTKIGFHYSIVDDLYVSPAVKRAIWQTLLVVKELKKVLKKDPAKIFVEVARGEEEKRRTISRRKQLIDLYKACKQDERDWVSELESKTDSELRKDKLYLYYTQQGRCMYSGESIDLSKLLSDNTYDIDHIYPRSLTNDDSLNNRVLVKKEFNKLKGDSFPIGKNLPSVQDKMHGFWSALLEKGFITKRKYDRLTRKSSLTQDELAGFINRQLVETRQSTKAITEVLKKLLPNTAIVFSKAETVSTFRNVYEIHKCRDINDFHHAHDAYLNVVVGNVYDVKFTRSALNFIKNAPSRSYNLYKMFDNEVNGAWNPSVHMQTVRKTFGKNNVLVTRMVVEVKGGFFDQMIVKKGLGQHTIKPSDERLSIEKYGGYNKVKGAYFSLVEHGKEGNRIRTFESVPIEVAQSRKTKTGLEKYFSEEIGLLNVDIKVEKIKINSLLCINGFFASITGRSNNDIVIKNEVQLVLELTYRDYVRKIMRFLTRKKRYASETVKDFDCITVSQNIELFDEFTKKLDKTSYSKKMKLFAVALENGRENFCELPIENQCEVLKEVLTFFQCNRVLSNLSQIKGAGNAGLLKINKTLSEDKLIYLIDRSPTGLFEKRIDLLKI